MVRDRDRVRVRVRIRDRVRVRVRDRVRFVKKLSFPSCPLSGPLGKKSLHWPFRVLEPLSRKNLVPLVMESLCAFVQSSWE